jgi:hypothetical protein
MEHASDGLEAEQAVLRPDAQSVTIVPSTWAAKAAAKATARGKTSLARIASLSAGAASRWS